MQDLQDGEADVKANVVRQLQRPHRVVHAQLHHMVKMGLCAPEKLEKVYFAPDLAEVKRLLSAM